MLMASSSSGGGSGSGSSTLSAGPQCARQGCGKPTWNGAASEFCSHTCRQVGALAAFCTKATQEQCEDIEAQFTSKWDTGRGCVPQIKSVWVVHASKRVKDRFHAKCRAIGHVRTFGCGKNPGNQQRRFHGTFLRCKFSGTPCSNPACSACCIIRDGFDIRNLGRGSGNSGWFGPGHYSTSMPSTAVGYGTGNALLVVHVAVGKAEKTSSRTDDGVSSGYHSRVVNKSTGVDELLVPEDDQMLPAYLVILG
mmetsp:Transcript_7387/g.22545  ORF Transcript_7387/g.22545 Transcript_7387/m.22545 type:complete len:251 (+) Transcript_7387:2-754(+)